MAKNECYQPKDATIVVSAFWCLAGSLRATIVRSKYFAAAVLYQLKAA